MKVPRSGSRKHIDEEKVRAKEEFRKALPLLLECGDEDRFVELVKAHLPNITPEELVSFVGQFRAVRLHRSRGA